jgi:hypothetical protein
MQTEQFEFDNFSWTVGLPERTCIPQDYPSWMPVDHVEDISATQEPMFVAQKPLPSSQVSHSSPSTIALFDCIESVPLTKEKLFSLHKQRCVTQARDKSNKTFFRRIRKYEAKALKVDDLSKNFVCFEQDKNLQSLHALSHQDTIVWTTHKSVKQVEYTTSVFYLNFEFKRGIQLKWKLFDLVPSALDNLKDAQLEASLFRISVADYATHWPLDNCEPCFMEAPFVIESFKINFEEKSVEALIRIKTNKGTQQIKEYRIGGTGCNGIMLGMKVTNVKDGSFFYLEPVLCSRNFKTERKKNKKQLEDDDTSEDAFNSPIPSIVNTPIATIATSSSLNTSFTPVPVQRSDSFESGSVAWGSSSSTPMFPTLAPCPPLHFSKKLKMVEEQHPILVPQPFPLTLAPYSSSSSSSLNTSQFGPSPFTFTFEMNTHEFPPGMIETESWMSDELHSEWMK